MAIALGVHDWTRGSAQTGNRSLTVTEGSCIVACWMGGERTVSFSDGVNTYATLNGDSGDTSLDIAWGVAFDVAGGATTVGFDSGTSSDFTYFAAELTGDWGAGAAVENAWGSQFGLGDTTPIAQAIATSAAGIVLGAINAGGSASAIAPDCADASPTTGWVTIDEDESPAAGVGGSFIYQIFGASGTRTAGWTFVETLNTIASAVALIEGAPSSPTGKVRRRGRLMLGVG